MWVSPNHPNPPRPAAPPAETGRPVVTFRRGDNAELRVALGSYQRREFVSLRVWERGTDGRMWPAKGKGCSIRLGEIAGMIEALQHVEDLIASGAGARVADRPRREPPATPARLPFDEF